VDLVMQISAYVARTAHDPHIGRADADEVEECRSMTTTTKTRGLARSFEPQGSLLLRFVADR
jgi:hypothetical protein